MADPDPDMLRRIAAAARDLPTSHVLTANRQAAGKLLADYLQRTGFPLDEFNRLKAAHRAERRCLLAAAEANDAGTAAMLEAESAAARALWRNASGLLAPQTTVITLDAPFEISLPVHARPIDFSKHIEPLNSFARVGLDTHSGTDAPVVFFFFSWQNPGPIAVINALTLLRFTGICQVEADSGIFSGHHNVLSVRAALALFRDTGWGTDANGNPLDGTMIPVFMGNTSQQVSFLDVQGGNLFDPPEIQRDTLAGRPIGLEADQIVVPSGASVLFQVQVQFFYSIEDGGDDDEVLIAFDDDTRLRRITCPFLKIELLQ